MFDRIIRLSVDHRGIVVLLGALILAWGGWVAAGLPVDVFPDLNRPTVTLMTEAGGLSPEEVELQITRPTEQAVAGSAGVERVRSQSAPGLSVVWVEFGWDVDVRMARQMVAERTAALDPAPQMAPISSIMGEILLVGLSAPDRPGPELRRLADQVLRPQLLAVPGVSQVTVIGGGVQQLQVLVDPAALARAGLGLDAVREAAGGAQDTRGGGFLDLRGQEHLVRVLARTSDPEALAATALGEVDGAPLLLGQVARVERGAAPKRGEAGMDGAPAVVLSVQKQPGADTLALTAAIDATLGHVDLGEDVKVKTIFRQADFISAAVDNVEESLRDGALLVLVILALFLLNLRTTAITLTAIPLSFVCSALVMHGMGLSINTMTLGGLAVAIGELVDDAIVDVENVHRRLAENARLPSPRPALTVVWEASREVRGSIVFSTALVVLVFLPLFALGGVEGRLFAPLGIAYVTSILASMAVSLTLTPALSALLLPGTAHESRESGLVRRLKDWDARLLDWALPRPGLLMALTALLCLGAAATLPGLGTSFLPPFNEGTATVNVLAPPGTPLERSDTTGALAERQILAIPEVKGTGRRTGRAELDEHAEGVHYTEIDVDFHEEGRPREEVLAELRERLALIPGVSISVGQPISHRLDHLLSGVRAAIAVKIFGEDLAQLRELAGALAERMRAVEGVVDLGVEPLVLIPQLQVQVRREDAARYGVPAGHLAEDLETALAGEVVAQVPEGQRMVDIAVRFAPEWRDDPEKLAMAPMVLPDGRALPLANLAAIETGTGPNQILHENGQRRIVISANAAGRDVGSVAAEIQGILDEMTLPPGVSTRLGGQFESQRQATRDIALLSLVSLVAAYALLFAHFRSHALTLQVLLNIPLALVGAVAAIVLSGQPLSVATLVGLVTLCGIASRNTIMMISHYLHLAAHEGEAFGPALVKRGSLERLVPVAMTALCAGIGLLPLALAEGQPGKEILTPVAQVILGGLISSTLLDMVLTPAVFLRFGREATENHLRSLESP